MRSLLGDPAPSFDAPSEMLKACHDRIRAQCLTLEKLVVHLPLQGADIQAQQAARNVLRYFDEAGRNHHADEEVDLFPLLLAIGQTEQLPIVDVLQALLDEHRLLDALWVELRVSLSGIADGRPVPLEPGQVARFVEAYRAHTAREEAEVLPFAESRLDTTQLAVLSAAMVARRRTAGPQK